MSNITEITGSLSVGYNANVGNRMTVSGDITAKHDLKVEGWLEAPNIKGNNKGVFATIEALKTTYDTPEAGWIAGVLKDSYVEKYIVDGGEWKDSGQKYVETKGDTGADATIKSYDTDDEGNIIVVWNDGTTIKIPHGESAYEVAVAQGYVGTIDEWLASLKGETGETGATGAKGDTGEAGVSPVVEMSKSGKVTTIKITDKDGAKTSTINDGKDGGVIYPSFNIDSNGHLQCIIPTTEADINVELVDGHLIISVA